MKSAHIVGVVLVVAGMLGLAFDGVSFARHITRAERGPISYTAGERHGQSIPTWACLAAMVVGGAIVAMGSNKR